ncbi:MAG: hypothetical protein OXG39_15995 [Chloroflexi bacterium]|nr:hypothetical protein [Chloroflexota bacterium]
MTEDAPAKSRVALPFVAVLRVLPYQWLLPLCFFCLGLIYIYAAPHFEASDSIGHIGMIKWIADHDGALPVQSAGHAQLYRQQASQPPLYYFMMAAIWSALDTGDFDEFFRLSPFAIVGDPMRLGNRNRIFYRQPYPPNLHQGTSLTLYIIRLVTLGMGTVTVAAVFQSARTVMPGRVDVAALACALTAFNPQFIFISASASNDGLVIMLSALITWQTLLMLREGFHTRRSLVLALLIALASLAKLSGLVFAALVILAGLWILIRTRDRRGFLVLLGAVLLIWLAIAGWWFLRNLTLYQEPFGTAAMLDYVGRRQTTIPQLLTGEFQGLRISFWGLFGAFSILTHDIHYQLMDALTLLSAAGFLAFAAKHRRDKFILTAICFLVVILAVACLTLVWWSAQTTASTGRLLFPYITSISLLMALGLTALRMPALLVALPMFAFSIAAPFLFIIPNYDHPPQVDQLPASARQTFARWDEITLIGYELKPPERVASGLEIPITLYWRAQRESTETRALFISLVDSEGSLVTRLETFPGWGTLPTRWWRANTIYRDDYILQLPEDAAWSAPAQLHIGWYPFPGGGDMPPVLESGEAAAVYSLALQFP